MNAAARIGHGHARAAVSTDRRRGHGQVQGASFRPRVESIADEIHQGLPDFARGAEAMVFGALMARLIRRSRSFPLKRASAEAMISESSVNAGVAGARWYRSVA